MPEQHLGLAIGEDDCARIVAHHDGVWRGVHQGAELSLGDLGGLAGRGLGRVERGVADRDGGPGSISAEQFESRIRAAPDEIETLLKQLAALAPDRVWLGVSQHLLGDDARRLRLWRAVAARASIPLLATNDALYHEPARRELQDVVTCIREGVTLDEAGRRLEANGERHLKAPQAMAA